MTADDLQKSGIAELDRYRLPSAPMTMPVQELKPPSLLAGIRPLIMALSPTSRK